MIKYHDSTKRYRVICLWTIQLRYLCLFTLLAIMVMFSSGVSAKGKKLDGKIPSPKNVFTQQVPVQVNGVFPKMTVMADGVGSNSEAGIGALIPWANKLWAIGYVSHIRGCLLYTSPSPRDRTRSRMPSSA